MSFVRPEAAAVLARWRDVLIGFGLMALGTVWVVRGTALLPTLGVVVGLLGAAFVTIGLRRVVFPPGGDGPGIVEITERRIAYMGPETGGVVSIDALARVEIETGRAGLVWHLAGADGTRLAIPGAARGADGLFDALIALPGLNEAEAARAVRARTHDRFLIWQADRRALH
ncbi:MAG: hypothetical protein ACU0CO_11195 [Shimia sp.]